MRLRLITAIFLLATAAELQAAVISTTLVGNAGNANDPLTGNLYGGVGYEYQIGVTEVTNVQYVEFLNAKAKSDPLGLYNTSMGTDLRGGIARTGSDGSYSYAARPEMHYKPVGFVSWYDAVRFTNWLHNGQGNGDTETGAYTLLGNTAEPSNGLSIARNPSATWFLPTENEWYKAAYHQPAAQGGDADNYWLYPTASNTLPTAATADGEGDINNPGPNVANYGQNADWNGQNGHLTTVGSAGRSSDSYYGTADQGGNAFEWNETLVLDQTRRGARGGVFNLNFSFMQSTNLGLVATPTAELSGLGFRVATIAVPEPSTYALAALGVAGLLAFRRRER